MLQLKFAVALRKYEKNFLPDEGGGEPQDNRTALTDTSATVERISADIEVRGHEGCCTGAGYPQGSHGLAAQELSDAGAKHLPAITISVEIGRDQICWCR